MKVSFVCVVPPFLLVSAFVAFVVLALLCCVVRQSGNLVLSVRFCASLLLECFETRSCAVCGAWSVFGLFSFTGAFSPSDVRGGVSSIHFYVCCTLLCQHARGPSGRRLQVPS